jgi:hypothetical protein
MTKEAVFTMKLEADLRDEFMAEAQALHRPASQVLRDLMRDFIRTQREAREYDSFVRGKIKVARNDLREGRVRPHSEVEADFASKRAGLSRKSGKGPA